MICLAFINFEWSEFKICEDFFLKAYKVSTFFLFSFFSIQIAKSLNDTQIAHICLCNSGVAKASLSFEVLDSS